MAVGKEVGKFEMQSTSITLEPGKGDYLTAHANFEGTATGDLSCTAIATMTVETRDGKNGDYSVSARCFMDDGEILDAQGQGKTVLEEKGTWTVAGITEIDGNRSWAIQGTINLTDRSFNGKMFERN